MKLSYDKLTEVYNLTDILPDVRYEVSASFRVLPDRPYLVMTDTNGIVGVSNELKRSDIIELYELLPEGYVKWQLRDIRRIAVDVSLNLEELFRGDTSIHETRVSNRGGSSARLWYTRLVSSYMTLFNVTTYEKFKEFLEDFRGVEKECMRWDASGFYLTSIPIYTAYEGTELIMASDDFQVLYTVCKDMATTYNIETIKDVTGQFNTKSRVDSYHKKRFKYEDNILVHNLRLPEGFTATDDFQI